MVERSPGSCLSYSTALTLTRSTADTERKPEKTRNKFERNQAKTSDYFTDQEIKTLF